MWASHFQPAKEKNPKHNVFNDILVMIKDILVVANDFFKLKALDFIVDFLDKLIVNNQEKNNPFNM